MSESDMTLGEEIIVWIETTCRVPEGVLIGQPIQLMEVPQRFVVPSAVDYAQFAVFRGASHSRAVLSPEAVTTRVPSGENAAL
jgi:hypothetical protein